eukprot:GILJ01009712.1.p1 GENE.GILJ01009712.1~~GILJ01009712.1.p1  ORF type:complete len:681 (+),score=131.35 GILJ01009712.1:53-2095(+)
MELQPIAEDGDAENGQHQMQSSTGTLVINVDEAVVVVERAELLNLYVVATCGAGTIQVTHVKRQTRNPTWGIQEGTLEFPLSSEYVMSRGKAHLKLFHENVEGDDILVGGLILDLADVIDFSRSGRFGGWYAMKVPKGNRYILSAELRVFMSWNCLSPLVSKEGETEVSRMEWDHRDPNQSTLYIDDGIAEDNSDSPRGGSFNYTCSQPPSTSHGSMRPNRPTSASAKRTPRAKLIRPSSAPQWRPLSPVLKQEGSHTQEYMKILREKHKSMVSTNNFLKQRGKNPYDKSAHKRITDEPIPFDIESLYAEVQNLKRQHHQDVEERRIFKGQIQRLLTDVQERDKEIAKLKSSVNASSRQLNTDLDNPLLEREKLLEQINELKKSLNEKIQEILLLKTEKRRGEISAENKQNKSKVPPSSVNNTDDEKLKLRLQCSNLKQTLQIATRKIAEKDDEIAQLKMSRSQSRYVTKIEKELEKAKSEIISLQQKLTISEAVSKLGLNGSVEIRSSKGSPNSRSLESTGPDSEDGFRVNYVNNDTTDDLDAGEIPAAAEQVNQKSNGHVNAPMAADIVRATVEAWGKNPSIVKKQLDQKNQEISELKEEIERLKEAMAKNSGEDEHPMTEFILNQKDRIKSKFNEKMEKQKQELTDQFKKTISDLSRDKLMLEQQLAKAKTQLRKFL